MKSTLQLWEAHSRAAAFAAVVVAACALYLYAQTFDFVCDDAFITLRYAKQFAVHGAPVYNLSEKVEGYTNFLWMVFAALFFKVGLNEFRVVHTLSMIAAFSVMGGVSLLWRNVRLGSQAWMLVPMALVGVTSTIAAWTGGGLESVLYAGLLASGLGLAARAIGHDESKVAYAAGACLGFASLTRPEGVVPMALFALLALAMRRKKGWPVLWRASAAFSAVFVPFFVWRFAYYGAPLPNTFYLKTSGVGSELRARGLEYLRLALDDFGAPIMVMLAALCVPACEIQEPESPEDARGRRALLWLLRLNVAFVLPYVMSVGGDFLALYRFFAPAIPLLAVGFCLGVLHLKVMLPPSVGASARAWWVTVVVVVVAGAHTLRQLQMSETSLTQNDPRQAAAHVEPLHWTALYAKRWGAMGRWIAEHAKPGDGMAVGAAGAMPFYAGLEVNNLDILGLCDEYVAKHGTLVGSRPGHQRRSPLAYTLSKRPVFLFEGDYDSDTRHELSVDRAWESRGYVWAEATVTREQHHAPSTFYYYFLMRQDRALQLRTSSHLRFAAAQEPGF